MKPKIKELLFGAFAVACVPAGFAIHGWVSLIFLMAGSICGSFSLYYILLNHRVHNITDSKARNWSLFLFVLSLLGAFLYWREYKQPNLHLELYGYTSDAPDNNLNFTNDFLFVKMDKDVFKFPTNLPFLVIDVARNEPQVTLNFEIFNNSAPPFSTSEFDIKKPEMRVWIANPDPGEAIKWAADTKWEEIFDTGRTTNGTEINFPGQVLRYQFPNSLAAGIAELAPGITFNMQEKPGALMVAVLVGGENVAPVIRCFKLLSIPSDETVSKLHFDTNNVIWWKWKYRPVAYRPIDTPLTATPSRVHLSDGTNAFGTEVTISNPSSSNLYAITFSVEMENGNVPINSVTVDLSQPKNHQSDAHGDLQIPFEASMDFNGPLQSRLFMLRELDAKEDRMFWIKGTILTNSFADISIWQSFNSFPDVKYTTNSIWMWPILTSDSAWWMHVGEKPIDMDFGIMAWRGNATNGFTNNSQIIPSRP